MSQWCESCFMTRNKRKDTNEGEKGMRKMQEVWGDRPPEWVALGKWIEVSSLLVIILLSHFLHISPSSSPSPVCSLDLPPFVSSSYQCHYNFLLSSLLWLIHAALLRSASLFDFLASCCVCKRDLGARRLRHFAGRISLNLIWLHWSSGVCAEECLSISSLTLSRLWSSLLYPLSLVIIVSQWKCHFEVTISQMGHLGLWYRLKPQIKYQDDQREKGIRSTNHIATWQKLIHFAEVLTSHNLHALSHRAFLPSGSVSLWLYINKLWQLYCMCETFIFLLSPPHVFPVFIPQ